MIGAGRSIMRHWKLIGGTCIALAVAVGGLSVTASAESVGTVLVDSF